MAIQWGNILVAEVVIIGTICYSLGFVKLPKFLRRKTLVPGSPWGYYPDQQPKPDSYFSDNDQDFLHDVATGYGGMDGFGEFGEFTGFGEMGEFGAHFAGGAMGDGSG
ncbi:MAG: hypothetical protein U0105_20325 [Candidatus Obscuribacterales bacterium]